MANSIIYLPFDLNISPTGEDSSNRRFDSKKRRSVKEITLDILMKKEENSSLDQFLSALRNDFSEKLKVFVCNFCPLVELIVYLSIKKQFKKST